MCWHGEARQQPVSALLSGTVTAELTAVAWQCTAAASMHAQQMLQHHLTHQTAKQRIPSLFHETTCRQYFKPHLQDLAPGQDTEIAVQCNLVTFDWLMAYVKASITGVQPVLDCSNCISILVACSFLKMTQLVRYVQRPLEHVPQHQLCVDILQAA